MLSSVYMCGPDMKSDSMDDADDPMYTWVNDMESDPMDDADDRTRCSIMSYEILCLLINCLF